MTLAKTAPEIALYRFPHRHMLGIEGLSIEEITMLLDLADAYVDQNRKHDKKSDVLRGRTVINLFFENSTRTQASFELAGKRLGGDIMNMSVSTSSIKKGETMIDTAMTLNAMHPDVLVVRHPDAGAVKLLSEKVTGAVINAGDGRHEHPTQALLDALTIRRAKGRLHRLSIAICGDIAHSRVARSNIMLQTERMRGTFVPSIREYFHFFGLDHEKLSYAKPDAFVMHPGPMNRGVEIDSDIADDINRSVIRDQVEMGVAVRMACLDLLTRDVAQN